MKKKILFFSVLLFLTTSLFASSKDDEAKRISIPEGKSVIYILRPNDWSTAYFFVNKIDTTGLKTTGGHEFVYLVVDPGTHKVVCKGSTKESELELTTEAGKAYYVNQELKTPPFPPGIYWSELTLLKEQKKIDKAFGNCRRKD